MVAISGPWYNSSYTMAAKPIKSLELHYTMIQFLIMRVITTVRILNILKGHCHGDFAVFSVESF